MNFAATKKQDAPPPKKPMTAPTVERARRTSVPLECPLDDGVFLMYEKETDTVYAQWSKTPQTTALAWLKPLVAIPEHKYKVNGGRQNLFTKAVEEGKYYKGWIRFICIVNEYPSKLMLLENFAAAAAPDVQLLLLIPSGVAAGEASAAAAAATAAGGGGGGAESTCVAVALDLYNKLYDLKNVFAVAAVPCSSKLIPTQQPITPHKFLQMGTGEGDAASIHLKKT
ncbi:hypothetical protein, conserved [Eimeria acervulina]|uniref:Immune mapped protein 2 N-terminal domain-containing protein n=1 Tax=Eimeria acervulina TaxID=5801 RepID=U6GVS8_EIMAC|nr:hypothetical protein, conserved [Eimeria acervulina]CDI84285.1 hypothetical protein, conserved [Eimeria acervulina]